MTNLFFLLLLSWSLIASTEARARVIRLTFQDCIQHALVENNEIRAAQEVRSQAQWGVDSARSRYFPALNGSLSKSRSYLSSVTADSSSAQLNLNQNIFAGWGDSEKLSQAEYLLKSAEADLQLIRSQILSKIRRAVIHLTYSDQLMRLQVAIRERRTQNLKIVEASFNGGRENKGSLSLSEAYMAQANYEIQLAESEAIRAQNELRESLAISIGDTVEILDYNFFNEPPKLEQISMTDGELQILVAQTPEYIKAQASQKAAEANVRATKSAFYPSLDLAANVGTQDFDTSQASPKWFAGLTLTIPIFSGGKDLSSFRTAVARSAEVSHQTDDQYLKLRSQISQAYLDYRLSYEKLKMDKAFESAAKLRSEISRKKYNNGLMAFEDWDAVEGDLITRQKNYLNSQRDSLYLNVAWELAIGRTR